MSLMVNILFLSNKCELTLNYTPTAPNVNVPFIQSTTCFGVHFVIGSMVFFRDTNVSNSADEFVLFK